MARVAPLPRKHKDVVAAMMMNLINVFGRRELIEYSMCCVSLCEVYGTDSVTVVSHLFVEIAQE